VYRLSGPESALRDLGGAIRAVHFAVPDDGRWVDPAGHYVADAPGGPCVELVDEAGAVLRLLVARADESVESLARLSPAARLSLRNAQLAAVAKARVADVQASRRRVVATSDAERQRIERDLHDGAQQRLVSAAFYLSVARRRLPSDAEPLARAEKSVSVALANLRGISHGIFPNALATEGLGAALEDLVGMSEVPARLDLHGVDDEVSAETAMPAYATVAAALAAARAWNATAARISVGRRDRTLTVCVETDVSVDAVGPSTFTDVIDRVGAVGGEFSASTTEGVARVTAVFPCAS
jgi:signal transduction histidine kinase